MARPRKWRKVCDLPKSNRFGPLENSTNEEYFIIMEIDEYETIRLIDLEGLTQEECSDQMNIARTTVQRIYSQARNKIAKSLVRGKVLRIEGGSYKLCDGSGEALCANVNCAKESSKEKIKKENENENCNSSK